MIALDTFKAGDEVTVRVPVRCAFVAGRGTESNIDTGGENHNASSRAVVPGERFTVAHIDEDRAAAWVLPLRAAGELWIPISYLARW